jgi:hypothetical protein
MVRAARSYLTGRYARGVEQMLWESDQYPMSDLDAINAVRAAAVADDLPGPDLAAALVLVQAARLDLDQLEAKVLRAAQHADMSWDSIATVLGLPSPDLAEEHFRQMIKRESEPTDPSRQHRLSDSASAPQGPHQPDAEESSADSDW